MQPVVLNLTQNSFTSKYKYNMHKAKGASSYYIIRWDEKSTGHCGSVKGLLSQTVCCWD